MKEQAVFYLIIALSVVVEAVSILTLNVVLIALTSILLFSSAVVHRLWYVIDSFIFKHTNLVEVFGRFELSGDRASAVRKESGTVSATAVAALEVGTRSEVDRNKVENILAHINYPFKFVMQAERLNIDKLLDRLQTKRSTREIELSRIDHSSQRHLPAINRIKRELEVLSHDIENISAGEVPLRLAYYIMTTAVSESRFDAEERAKSQIRELSSQFDALLSSKSRMLHGNDLLRILELDSSMVMD